MMGFGFIEVIFTLIISGFGGGDLLDYMSTEGYWQAKNVAVSVEQLVADAKAPVAGADVSGAIKDLSASDFATRDAARKKIEAAGPGVSGQLKAVAEGKDEEAATIAKELMEKFAERGKERDVRRLMAIRTLGEKKEKSALPVLKEALASKEPFVAAYAAKAMALIEGKLVPAYVLADISKDVWMVPADAGTVVQARGTTGQQIPVIEEILKKLPKRRFGPMPMEDAGDEKAEKKPGDGDVEKQMRDETYKQVLKVAERVGNVRIDGVTFALARDIGERDAERNEKGWAVAIARGTYDRSAAVAAAASLGGKVEEKDGIITVSVNDNVNLVLPSNGMLVVVAGPRIDAQKPAIEAVIKAIKDPAGVSDAKGLGETALGKRIKALDRSGPGWAIFEPNLEMRRNAKPFAAVERMTVTSRTVEEKGAKRSSFTVVGEFEDAEKAKALAEEMQGHLKEGIEQVKKAAEEFPLVKDYVATLESLKIEAKDKTVTVTGTAPENLMSVLGGSMGFFAVAM